MNKSKFLKIFFLIALISIVFIFLILITYDLANETENWKFLGLDFNNKNEIISSYGTLIGGILSFLSILFVLVSLIQQREQLQNEKEEKLIYETAVMGKYFYILEELLFKFTRDMEAHYVRGTIHYF